MTKPSNNLLIAEIRDLHLSYGEIAAKYEISREYVERLAREFRPESRKKVSPSGDFVRCPECGGMVQMPCLECYVDNGGKHLFSIVEKTINPVPAATHRVCRVCNKRKPIRYFGRETAVGQTTCDILTVCQVCRQTNDLRSFDQRNNDASCRIIRKVLSSS